MSRKGSVTGRGLVVGVLRVGLIPAEGLSGRERIQVLASLQSRIHARYEVTSVKRPSNADDILELVVACLSSSRADADSQMSRIADYIVANPRNASVADINTEIVHLD
jgi:uncharacterized protein YlxP (DUF503 family)